MKIGRKTTYLATFLVALVPVVGLALGWLAGRDCLAAPGDSSSGVVLLDFTANWCRPCRQMAPTIERLIAAGYPIRKVNIDRQRDLAARYRVHQIPCFVLVAGGKEVERIVGPASYARFERMFETARAQQRGAVRDQVRGQSPHSASPPSPASPTPPKDPFHALQSGAPSKGESLAGVSSVAEALSGDQAQSRALAATVLLNIADARGFSHGTGVIIDTHGDEALVLTCGHVFRESGGRGRITAQLFAPGSPPPLPAELIDFDANYRDVGLVSVKLKGFRVTPVRVAPPSFRPREGMTVFSIGCDRGGPAQVRISRVTGINRYIGAPNIEAAGAPVQGRSGGGLFSAEGLLIGICNAADQTDNEGLYAALPSIYWQLDRIGQSRIYNRGQSLPPAEKQLVSSAKEPPSKSSSNPVAAALQSERRELICIMRSPHDPQASGEVIFIKSVSEDLFSRIKEEQRRQTSAETARRPLRELSSPPVVRGQSRR